MNAIRRLGLLITLTLATGCFWSSEQPAWVFMPEMRQSVPYDSFAANPVFADGKTLQRPAAGTIPQGFLPFPYGPGAAEAERAGRELSNPLPPSSEGLERGAHLYRTFCSVCHGGEGAGDGPIVAKSTFPPPPAYTSTGLRDYPPGRLYHVITWGSARMPAYKTQISPDDRWHLVRWVQKLQQPAEATP